MDPLHCRHIKMTIIVQKRTHVIVLLVWPPLNSRATYLLKMVSVRLLGWFVGCLLNISHWKNMAGFVCLSSPISTFEFSLNGFIAFIDKIYQQLKWFNRVAFCVRRKYVTAKPQSHKQQIIYSNWPNSYPIDFVKFAKFNEFTDFPFHLRKTWLYMLIHEILLLLYV